MKNTNKRGFTIVELVIVVAVIAILSAVLIPTFSGIIDKANESADIQAVRNMNVALATATDKPENIIEAAAVLSEAGFNTEKGLTPAYKGHSYYWFKPTNQVVYVNEADDKFELIFPESVEGFPTEKNNDCLPLSAALEGVVNAPVVSETTATIGGNNIPDEVGTSFEDTITWLTNDEDKNVRYTDAYGNEKSGIVLTGGTIKLAEDIVLDTPNTNSALGNVGNTLMFNIVGDVTLDLNGHTITQYGFGRSMNLFIVREGSLSIIDSSAEKTGAIYVSLGAFQINAGSTVNLYSGTIAVTPDEYRSSADKDEGSCIVNMNGGTFNMYGGKIDATTLVEDDYEDAFAGYGVSTTIVNLYAGEVVGTTYAEGVGGEINDYIGGANIQ